MSTLANSIVRFSWALSVFGAQELVETLMPSTKSPGRAPSTEALRAITQLATQQLGDATQVVFRAGDTLQQKTLDLIFPVDADPESGSPDITPAEVFQESAKTLFHGMQTLLSRPDTGTLGWGYCSAPTSVSEALLPQVARLISLLIPGPEGRLAWQEFKNKFEVFELVQRAGSVLHVSDGTSPSLSQLVQRAYSLGSFPALWGLEGLGKQYADEFWKRAEKPDQILSRKNTGDLPSASLAMLHAGMGLSFASQLFALLQDDNQTSSLERVVREFLALCRNNSREGYQGAAIESMGLVVRELYPSLVLAVDHLLATLDEEKVAYFWHGVGRALYFLPVNFLPSASTIWCAVRMCQQEAPHALGRMNCRAGLAWAITLVNLRQPEIMEALLQQHGDQLAGDGTFAAGVGSALILRYDTTPQDTSLADFCGHQVKASPALAERWREQVCLPCENALRRVYPRLKERHLLEQIFRFRPQTGGQHTKAAA
jgi:hypothetical protein